MIPEDLVLLAIPSAIVLLMYIVGMFDRNKPYKTNGEKIID